MNHLKFKSNKRLPAWISCQYLNIRLWRYILNSPVSISLTVVFVLLYHLSFAQNLYDIRITAPSQTYTDSGRIFQDTVNDKVYSWINKEHLSQEIQFKYQVTKASDITSLKPTVGSYIRVERSDARFYVLDSWPHSAKYAIDDRFLFETANDNVAVLMPRDNGFYIEDLGATPDYNTDDDYEAIQTAIDVIIALYNTKNVYNSASNNSMQIPGRINAGPGNFRYSKGIVAARKSGVSSYADISFSLVGCTPTYGGIWNKTSFECTSDTSFALAIQYGRNILIENIHFDGPHSDLFSVSNTDIVELTDQQWADNYDLRMNRYSPQCAIAIDPFDTQISTSDQYPGFDTYYDHQSVSGTSQLTIRGCSFFYHYIAVANNPSKVTKNGDNIRMENSHVKYCHTAWACGNTQSRSNSIDNLYTGKIHTFIDNISIGQGNGDVPSVMNANLAGFCKRVYNVDSWGMIRMTNSYMESVWSLGRAQTIRSTEFDNCYIKFAQPDPNAGYDVYAPPYHLTSNATSFKGCYLGYYSDCSSPGNLFINSTHHVNFIGGWIEGGPLVIGNGYHLNLRAMPNFTGAGYYCFPFTVGYLGMKHSTTVSVADDMPLVGGDEITIHDYAYLYEQGNPNKVVYKSVYHDYCDYTPENCDTLFRDKTTRTAYFIVDDPGVFKVSDNLYGATVFFDNTASGMHGSAASKGPLGYVYAINGDTIKLKNVTMGIYDTTNIAIRTVRMPQLIPPMWGTFTYNNDTIKEILEHTNTPLKVGDRIFNDAIKPGTHIIYVDPSRNFYVMSTKAKASVDTLLIYDAIYEQTIYTEDGTFPANAQQPIKEGCKMWYTEPTSSVVGKVCVKGGILNHTNTADRPVWGAITY